MNILVFDIETIPDVASGRRLYGNPTEMAQLNAEDVARVMSHYRQQQTDGQTEILRHHLQQVIAISVVFRFKGKVKNKDTGQIEDKDILDVRSLAQPDASEKELVQQFFSIIKKYTPNLVSWNGNGFDLPVLHYRSLLHGVNMQRYWEKDQIDDEYVLNNFGQKRRIHFQYNKYFNRYNERHLDLMDMLSGYQSKSFASLNDIATLLGLPGKMGMSGDKVWEAYLQGEIQQIRDYCETDVLNTYLIYLRFELTRGKLSPTEYSQECQRVQHWLSHESKPHFTAFAELWQQSEEFQQLMTAS
jgi:predicted PolB exonuclease-like 3'-5' exonuclease